LNCPAAHSQQQQNKKESPANPTDGRDLAKINSVATQSLHLATTGVGALVSAPAELGDGIHLQTLVTLHTCLRV
jgi:hypothetical protein